MSTGSKLPALPPKTGCLVCGSRAHGADRCLHGADLGLSTLELRKVADRQGYRDSTERLRRETDAILSRPVAPMTAAERLAFEEEMDRDIQIGVNYQLRATRMVQG